MSILWLARVVKPTRTSLSVVLDMSIWQEENLIEVAWFTFQYD